MGAGRIHVGTCGWSYDHWEGAFYPPGLHVAERLGLYASRFGTVEVDSTFYRLPSERSVAAWCDSVPDDFVFSVKGSQLVSHFHRLHDVDALLETFIDQISAMGPRLGVVLWQLPRSMTADSALLEQFLRRLPNGATHYAIEFRHESWLSEETFALLRRFHVAQVHVSSDAMPVDLTPTADFVYVRFHGLARFGGAYDAHALRPWADFLREQADHGRDCYAYFNNDAGAHAPADAARLVRAIGDPEAGRRRGAA